MMTHKQLGLFLGSVFLFGAFGVLITLGSLNINLLNVTKATSPQQIDSNNALKSQLETVQIQGGVELGASFVALIGSVVCGAFLVKQM